MAITRNDIIEILRDELFIDITGVEDSTLLFSSNLIDSFALASLIVELETRGGFRIAPLDITLENLDTIERMLKFTARLETAGS